MQSDARRLALDNWDELTAIAMESGNDAEAVNRIAERFGVKTITANIMLDTPPRQHIRSRRDATESMDQGQARIEAISYVERTSGHRGESADG